MFLIRLTYFLPIAALLQIIFGYASCHCSDENFGVINGHSIPIEDAPYMAVLKFRDPLVKYVFCGASIVHERFLLTSAYCQVNVDVIVAQVGSESYKKRGTGYKVAIEEFLCHEDFDRVVGKNDICLVKLKEPLIFSEKIAKIDLPVKNFDVKTGVMLNVTGWGLFSDNDTVYPYDLHQTTIPVVSHDCCHDADHTVDDTMICAGVRGRGPCFGDGGGPLTLKNVLVGIVSHQPTDHIGPICGSGLDIFTRVTSFVDWINTSITNNL